MQQPIKPIELLKKDDLQELVNLYGDKPLRVVNIRGRLEFTFFEGNDIKKKTDGKTTQHK